METFALVLTTLIGGGLGGIIATWFFNKKALIHKVNFERKQSRYTHIIAIIEVFLDPSCVIFLISKPLWNFQQFSEQENKEMAIKELKINFRQIMLLTRSKKLIDNFEKFIVHPSEASAKVLIACFRKDLWR